MAIRLVSKAVAVEDYVVQEGGVSFDWPVEAALNPWNGRKV